APAREDRLAPSGAPASARVQPATLGREALSSPAVVAFIACVALAIISAIALSWIPSSDPWAWIDWGQGFALSNIPAGINGGPSWKPLPAIFTTAFAFFGGAAPKMWLVIPRAAGLLAAVAAF